MASITSANKIHRLKVKTIPMQLLSQVAYFPSGHDRSSQSHPNLPRLDLFALVVKWLSRSLIVLSLWLLLGTNPTLAIGSQTNYSRIDLRDRNFAGQDLAGGVFVSSELRGVDLSGANLTNAMLTMAVLLKSNLSGANLTGALADRATFDEADLTNAILTEATLTRSRFYGAKITGADFTDALIDRAQAKLLCDRAEGTNPVTGVDTRDSLGCR